MILQYMPINQSRSTNDTSDIEQAAARFDKPNHVTELHDRVILQQGDDVLVVQLDEGESDGLLWSILRHRVATSAMNRIECNGHCEYDEQNTI